MDKKWPPDRGIKYKHCKKVIVSSYPGEFVWCDCRTVAIDQTEYYERRIGNFEDYEVVDLTIP